MFEKASEEPLFIFNNKNIYIESILYEIYGTPMVMTLKDDYGNSYFAHQNNVNKDVMIYEIADDILNGIINSKITLYDGLSKSDNIYFIDIYHAKDNKYLIPLNFEMTRMSKINKKFYIQALYNSLILWRCI